MMDAKLRVQGSVNPENGLCQAIPTISHNVCKFQLKVPLLWIDFLGISRVTKKRNVTKAHTHRLWDVVES